MKVVLLNGSPHEKGTTFAALTEVANSLNANGIDTEIINVGNHEVSGCTVCCYCVKNNKCVKNDIVNEIIEKIQQADGVVVGSPVYFASLNGTLKCVLDRVFFAKESFANKPAAAVAVARRAGTTATYDQINKYFGITQMPIISTRYWNMAFGRNADDVKQDAEGMQALRILARNMAYYLKCIEAGKEKGITPPEQEKVTLTNFIR